MSKMFDYISGKKGGKIAKLEAELEHVMAHCVPASALDKQRHAIIEECAREFLAALSGIGDIRIDHVHAAVERVRALKDKS